jgi:hypothetical protein
MLYDVKSGKEITKLPYRVNYEKWRKNMNDEDFQKIFDELNVRVDQNEIHTSSWIPGSDWTNTVFQPIYEACSRNVDDAAKFFGLILWEVMMERPEFWAFGRYQKDGMKIEGLTYFKVEPPISK